jgi:protein TonB
MAIAMAITFGLFVLMSSLIASQPGSLVEEEQTRLNLFRPRVPLDPAIDPPKSKLPEPPVEQREPLAEVLQIPRTRETRRGLIALPTGKNGIAIPPFIPKLKLSASNNHPTIPIIRVNPIYPRIPLQRGIEGWVEVEFTINAAGDVLNPRIVDAEPPGVFNRSVLRAVKSWKYEPMLVDGKPIIQQGVRWHLDFEAEKR